MEFKGEEQKRIDKLREKLAQYAHKAWSGWMMYLFEKSIYNDDGTVTIPKWAVERWNRQMKTLYENLSKEEKDSDKDEADKIIRVINDKMFKITEGVEERFAKRNKRC